MSGKTVLLVAHIFIFSLSINTDVAELGTKHYKAKTMPTNGDSHTSRTRTAVHDNNV